MRVSYCKYVNVLSIAGSDPSSGAGIQGDVKTFDALGVYGLTVITALTSQNTSKFFTVSPVSPSTVKEQLNSVFSDFEIDAIKIGMIYSSQIVKVLYNELKHVKIPIILDPIFESTTGGKLLQDEAYKVFKKFLMPLAYVITPNIPESERIANTQIRTLSDLKKTASIIRRLGPKNVIIKGGHMRTNTVTDLLLEDKRFHFFHNKKIKRESHGGGCVFSAALCVAIARKKPLVEAVRFAQKMSFESIKNARKTTRGLRMATQKNVDVMEKELGEIINKFINIRMIHMFIPECQTNFVYSIPKPNSTKDILGLEGRIVKTGESITVAGDLKYGGSRHVASAVLEISRKFPAIRSALNIKYSDKLIENAIANRFHVSSYNRSFESQKGKEKEGKTISWGINTAINGAKTSPDIIYHKGDVGKEPMIIVFGNSPNHVLAKLLKIIR